MGIDVWMRKLAYVTYRTGDMGNNSGERYPGPQPVYNNRSSGCPGHRVAGPNRNILSLRTAYLVATDAQDNPGGVGRPDGGRASSLRPAPI